MKTHYAVALSMLTGAMLAAAAVEALHAQATSSFIYLVTETDLTDIKKMTEYDVTYGPKMSASVRAFGGRLVVS
jgi:predicted lipoprotein with Yx(FWY)xxD motif